VSLRCGRWLSLEHVEEVGEEETKTKMKEEKNLKEISHYFSCIVFTYLFYIFGNSSLSPFYISQREEYERICGHIFKIPRFREV
jgi:hypothetical protein